MTKQTLVVGTVIALIVAMTPVVLTDVPQLISFQGNLNDDAGNPLTGQYEITFRIYSVESGGTPAWTETNNVNCVNGFYNVILGQTTPLNLDFDGQYWLGIQVTGDNELSPRYRLTSVPTAYRAAVADSLAGVGGGDSDDDWTGAGTGSMYATYPTDKVGIGTTSPEAKLEVIASEGGDGVYGKASSGHGVYGLADSGIGIQGHTNSGKAVSGIGMSGVGVYGYSISGDAMYGFAGSGRGVFGKSSTGPGGYFTGGGKGLSAPALYAEATDETAEEPAGIAIYGKNHSGDATIVARNTSEGDLFRGIDSENHIVFAVRNNGTTSTRVLEITGGSDLAEPFDIAGSETIKPGMVVVIDPERPGRLRLAERAYDRTVAGIVSGAKGVNPGLIMSQEGTAAEGSLPVALTGRAYAWADASSASIEPGDLLTTSDFLGHVMKVTDYSRAQGAIIGKAMSSLDKGQGLVLVLVTLQ